MSLRDLTGEIAIVVEEFPDEDTLDEIGAKPRSTSWACCATDADHPVLVMYRRAVLDYWVEQGDELAAVLTHVMVHETAHRLNCLTR